MKLERVLKLRFLLGSWLLFIGSSLLAQPYVSKVWVADNGDGTYKNPVLMADYSDPDAIRVGDDYYLVSSTFTCTPGLPILHSKDLVNWTIVNYALKKQVPEDVYATTRHGKGVWAPAIRYHKGEFYIYYPDPDYGIYMIKTKNPAGEWSAPVQVIGGKGLIDPCPLWDDNGNAYLANGWAGSRAGVNSILTIFRMNEDGTKTIDDGRIVYDGHELNHTIEGPKLYKRNGYYYIFAPAGGVTGGWQLVLRSKDIYGPYEEKIVMDQGTTDINGPHQGAWVDTQTGEDWFLHFQDKGAYGRVTHLQPMKWLNNWPVIGIDKDGDGKGEPVLSYQKPNVKKVFPICTPAESDEFNSDTLGLQWEWNANPKVTWMSLIRGKGYLRMYSVKVPENFTNFWDVPNLLLQKFPALDFAVTTKLRLTAMPLTTGEGCKTGLIIMGRDYSYLSFERTGNDYKLSQVTCMNADTKGAESVVSVANINVNEVYLRVKVSSPDAMCTFSYSTDGVNFMPFGKEFKARVGGWIGAKVGVFCTSTFNNTQWACADFDWFRVDK
ncbi:MAG: glycoside hydrolase 43 family protein [Bacteroidota bacterium]|nr:glycoside hydrolase 43 family protein [Bacteroidota bacterium]